MPIHKHDDCLVSPILLTWSSILREQEQLEADAREALPYVSIVIRTTPSHYHQHIQ